MDALYKIGLVALAACLLGCGPASAKKRVALVIGNGAYANAARLPNPAHDAEDVAAALKRSNFDVIAGTDLGQSDMQENAIRFARAANNADIAVFYYSGHAMQFNGVNDLMPIDAKLDNEAFPARGRHSQRSAASQEPAHPYPAREYRVLRCQ